MPLCWLQWLGTSEGSDDLVTPDLFFDAFWQAYPRRAEKAAARKAWPRALSEAGGNPQTIIDGAKRYADDPNREPTFTKYPATWLNRGCWDDDPLPPRPLAPGAKPAHISTPASQRKADLDRERAERRARAEALARD